MSAGYIFFMAVKVILVLASVICMIFLYVTSGRTKGVYDDYIAPLDKKQFFMKNFLYIGLYADSIINPERFMPSKLKAVYKKYDDKIMLNIIELYGSKDAQYYYEIHKAEKWTGGIFTFSALIFFSMVSAITNDAGNTELFFAAAIISVVAVPLLIDSGLKSKIEKKRLAIQLEFPEFINKLLLLVNAGMTISKAWEKIVLENKKTTPLYMELDITMAEINGGKPEALAYEEFARRCKIKEVMKCVSIIVLNLKKGGSQVVPALREQADDCWELRKATARQQGEKASSQLMLPMGIMLVGVIMIAVTPAIMAMSGV